MELFYENASGKIRFSGCGTGHGMRMYIKQVTGLGIPEKEFKVTGHANQPGQVLVSARDTARTITLSADVWCAGFLQQELRRILGVLYHPGILSVYSGAMCRQIACRCTRIEEPERHGQDICGVVLQFTCDKPYFTDAEARRVTLFSRRDLVSGSLTLPCVFTERVSRRTVVNRGQVPAEPVLEIYNMQDAADAVSLLGASSGIELVNHTTGHRLQLDYSTSAGEVITVDIPRRQIISSLAGDITGAISQNSFLCNFYLESGENDIEAFNYNTDEALSILLTYENQYIEAVV